MIFFFTESYKIKIERNTLNHFKNIKYQNKKILKK